MLSGRRLLYGIGWKMAAVRYGVEEGCYTVLSERRLLYGIEWNKATIRPDTVLSGRRLLYARIQY